MDAAQLAEHRREAHAEELQKHLFAAIYRGKVEAVTRFVEHGANVNAAKDDQMPLELALNVVDEVKKDLPDDPLAICTYLVRQGAEVKNAYLFDALVFDGNAVPKIAFLLDHGADIHSKNDNGETFLELVATYSESKEFDEVYELNTLLAARGN